MVSGSSARGRASSASPLMPHSRRWASPPLPNQPLSWHHGQLLDLVSPGGEGVTHRPDRGDAVLLDEQGVHGPPSFGCEHMSMGRSGQEGRDRTRFTSDLPPHPPSNYLLP